MKILKLSTLLLLSLLAMASCDNEDDSPVNELIGIWELNSLVVTNCDDPSDNTSGDDVIGCETDDTFEVCNSVQFEFTIGGELISTSTVIYSLRSTQETQTETESETFTYTIDQDSKTITSCDETNDCEEISYSISGNTLTLVGIEANNCRTTAVATKTE